MAYYNPHIAGYNPLYTLNNQGFFGYPVTLRIRKGSKNRYKHLGKYMKTPGSCARLPRGQVHTPQHLTLANPKRKGTRIFKKTRIEARSKPLADIPVILITNSQGIMRCTTAHSNLSICFVVFWGDGVAKAFLIKMLATKTLGSYSVPIWLTNY